MKPSAENRRVVRRAEIREIYESLAGAASARCDEIAAEFLAFPGRLAGLLARSGNELENYENSAEPFHNRPPGGEPSQARLESQHPANRWLQRVHGDPLVSNGLRELSFSYVDYEVCPMRTTSSRYENGSPAFASGRGGIDLLLSNSVDRNPIVGEIKADTDSTTPLVMLLQTLTYAVELSTPSQISRLRRHYDLFTDVSDETSIDIYWFLFEGYVSKCVAKGENQLGAVFAIAARLLAEPDCPKFLRRIVGLTVSTGPELSVVFRCDRPKSNAVSEPQAK